MIIDAPTTCPVCGAAVRIESQYLDAIGITVRVFGCGATQGLSAAGRPFPGIICPRTVDVIAQLRADNVRLGDRNVLLATELQAIADFTEEHLGAWLSAPMDAFGYLYDLKALRTVYDLAVEALDGEPSAPAAEVPHEPGQGSAGLDVSAASVSELA